MRDLLEVGKLILLAPVLLAPCPSRPNCVSTEAADPRHRMDPIPFQGSLDEAQERLRRILNGMARSSLTADRPGYLAATFRSRIFGFVDDAEFVLDAQALEIRFRSAARTGYYDFGVNRSRMEAIARAFLESR